MIEGVILTPLKQIRDERGKVMHMLRADSDIFNKFGEIVGIATGKINKEEVLKNEGFIPEDINYAVKTDRVASFLNLPIKVSLKNTSETNYEYSAQELYKYMRSAVVLIVGQE